MRKLFYILLTTVFIVACSDKESGLEPWEGVDDDGVTITVTPTDVDNIYTIVTNIKQKNIRWDLGKGDGKLMQGEQITAMFPFAGEYNIALSYKSPTSYEPATKKKILIVESDNPALIDQDLSPEQLMLSGGATFPDGKIWVVDSLSVGHLGVGQLDMFNPNWWAAGAYDKSGLGIYDDEMTFTFNGGLDYKSYGITFAQEDAWVELRERGAVDLSQASEDRQMSYSPDTADWTWKVVDEDGKKFLAFPDGEGFAMFYTFQPHKYEILSITENTIYLRQALDDKAWYFKLIVKGYVQVGDPEEQFVLNDYDNQASYLLGAEGVVGDFDCANPDQSGINTSAKVAKYDRSAQEWGTRFAHYEAIDLSKYNKVRMKLYFPSTNVYNPSGLKAAVSVRLQDTSSSEPWVEEANITFEVPAEEYDTWIIKEFDFSGYASRTDFNVLIIQLGAEGHSETGVFYFDDFEIYGGGN